MKITYTTKNYGLGERLVRDELFDLTLYRKLHAFSKGETQDILQKLIAVEKRHLAFWQNFFELPIRELDMARKVKLFFLVSFCRI